MNTNLLQNMAEALRHYKMILAFIERIAPNALLISVEKAVSSKEQFLEQLIEYCALEPTPEQKEAALAFITKDPKSYLHMSKSGKSIGFLDVATKECIRGWARYIKDEQVPTVALYIDGEEIATTPANIFRKDLLEKNQHSTGHCAFCFDNFDSSLLKEGSEVRVLVTDDVIELSRSPHYFSENTE